MQSIIKKIVIGCLLIVPFIALHVADGGTFDVLSYIGFNGLFFPFISGKNIIFRVLVEIAFAGWVLLAIRDTNYRINFKKSPLTIAYAVFMLVLLIADIFGVDRERSLWSNFERMEGFVGHIHLFAYFFVLSVMLPTLKEWQRMWKWFIAGDILILVYAYGQLMGAPGTFFAEKFPKMAEWFAPRFPIHMSSNRLDATIGNSAYFAIFCLMFIFITALMWTQAKERNQKLFYIVVMVLNLIGLLYSGTRGTMIGLLFGGLLTLGIVAWKEKGKVRQYFIAGLIVLLISVSSIFIFKNSSLVKSSSILSRIATISPNDVTGASRLAMWTISYQAWKESPILGYGQDNFSHVFARKFLPERMCNLEPWYDRSHDVFFDWLVAGGTLGLLTYLSLYGVALSLMWRKENDVPLREKAILSGMILGYFIHNIFVFDNLTSYILFAALLAYIVVRTGGDKIHTHGKSYANEEEMNLIWIPVIGIVLLSTLYYVNYRPLLVNRLVIEGMSIGQYAQTMPFPDAVKKQQDAFTSAIAMNTLGSEEAREQFLQMGVRMSQQISEMKYPEGTAEIDKQRAVQSIQNELQAIRDDVKASLPSHKDDVRMLSIYGMFYLGTGDAVNAEEILKQARVIAPKKQLLAFDLTRAYLVQRKFPEAYALSREVYDSSITCAGAQKWLLVSAAYAGKYSEAKAHVLESISTQKTNQTIEFDPDVLGGLVGTGQTQEALGMLLELKKAKPELGPQVDQYIGQMLSQVNKVAPPVKK